MNEILEGNKLIAEFDNKYTTDSSVWTVTDRRLVDEYKYHTSWDWLMPVVEKIQSICFMEIENTMCRVYNAKPEKEIRIYNTSGGCKKDGWKESLIETVWEAVIQFIKWYNQTKTS